MSDKMTFPEKWEDFIKQYSFKDTEGIYTNYSELIPIFRVKQMMDHYLKKDITISDDEYFVLKNINDDYKYIARDQDRELYIYSIKPNKFSSEWSATMLLSKSISFFNSLFQFVKWEDEEPYDIKKLIDTYEKEKNNEN